MNASQQAKPINRSIYRDFALIALAALGVGLAFSLTLATAIVLATPNRETTVGAARVAESPGLHTASLAQAPTPGAARSSI
jgi:hypothetical protein